MPFYSFGQNNSGGHFDFDLGAGIGEWVIVEASHAAEAISKARGIGLYFGGAESGRDCPCCGDRWSDWLGEGTDKPEIYGQDAAKTETYSKSYKSNYSHSSMGGIFVHYLSGKIERLDKE